MNCRIGIHISTFALALLVSCLCLDVACAQRGRGGNRSEMAWKFVSKKYDTNKDGEVLTLEFLIRAPVFERILGNYVENLKKIGIEPSIRLVDPSQFQARLDDFDFDIVGMAAGFGASPTAESLRFFLHSESADQKGSRNFPGIKSPAIDALIEEMKTV